MIDWEEEVIPEDLIHLVRPETRSKYFPKNHLRQYFISGFLEKLLVMVRKSGAENILDVGSGEGLVDFFITRNERNIELYGGDYDLEVLHLSQAINPVSSYIGLDAGSLPFASESFDLVMMNEVLEHLEDYDATVSEAARVSKKYAIFSVPEWPFYQAANFLILKNLKTWGEHPDHVAQFTRKSLKDKLKGSFRGGVEISRSFPWIIALAQK